MIALWVAVQTRVIETIDPSKIGNYNFWQDTGKSRYRNLLRLKNFQDDYLLNLEHFRNSIAHGGADSQTTGGFPNTEHLKYLLKDSEKRVRAFFREVPVGDLNRR